MAPRFYSFYLLTALKKRICLFPYLSRPSATLPKMGRVIYKTTCKYPIFIPSGDYQFSLTPKPRWKSTIAGSPSVSFALLRTGAGRSEVEIRFILATAQVS